MTDLKRSMRCIVRETVVIEMYVGGDGSRKALKEMEGTHLLNALILAVREDSEDIIGPLKQEILRRIKG